MAYYLPVRHEIDIDADSFMDKVRKTEPKAKSASRSIVVRHEIFSCKAWNGTVIRDAEPILNI